MSNRKIAPSWRKAQQQSGPCVVYNHTSTTIVTLAVEEVEGELVEVQKREVQPPTGPLNLAALEGCAPRSRASRVLRGAGGEGYTPRPAPAKAPARPAKARKARGAPLPPTYAPQAGPAWRFERHSPTPGAMPDAPQLKAKRGQA